ncbi:pyruvyl transferase [Microbacterium sp. BE35]|uniref:polysaccharide pyruvyl transferase family protein n=1 Tax=Microbacterium sp. BE35 TaxID=2817773 RepID=UPI0028672E95|nr:polysaccharide pyruvyl transferase family protein [Microbacterium sp. BE35]MDR7188709.1 pyruvyl transferase [Microbacterium sp. BE35]
MKVNSVTDLGGIELFHWNPRRPAMPGRLGRRLPVYRSVNNFGDMLGPAVSASLAPTGARAARTGRLLSIGSILHFARDGDVVWGSGVNGKVDGDLVGSDRLDVRAVRGPLTAEILRRRGVRTPEIFGDPGLLAPSVLGIARADRPSIPVTSLPNLHDFRSWRGAPGLLNPRRNFISVIKQIAASRLVVTSSLHGIVIADALGVPVAPVRPTAEAMFKYEDYYEGTGRRLPRFSTSMESAADARAPGLDWDPQELVAAFPLDLWSPVDES